MSQARKMIVWAILGVAVVIFGFVDGQDASAATSFKNPDGWQKKHHQKKIEGSKINPNELKAINTRLQKILSMHQRNKTTTAPQSQLREALTRRSSKPTVLSGAVAHGNRFEAWTIQWHERNGTPVSITGSGLSRGMPKVIAGASASQIAMGFIEANRDIFHLDNPVRELKVAEEFRDDLGNHHVKFEQWYQDVPVWGHDLVVHMESSGDLYAVNARYSPTPRSLTPNDVAIRAEQAIQTARDHLSSRTPIRELGSTVKRLLSYDGPTAKRYIWVDEETQKPHLVWHVQIRPNFRDQWYYFIDTRTGDILEHYNNTKFDGSATARVTDLQGRTQTINVYQVGTTYYMIDASRPIWQRTQPDLLNDPRGAIVTLDARRKDLDDRNPLSHVTSRDNTWNDRVAVSAHDHVGKVFDYYFTTHRRKGIDDQGGTLLSVIHVTEDGKPMENAFWNGVAMAFGDGDQAFTPLAGSLDVTAHELTHGVIERTVGLEYRKQSGALNESFADVFGVMTDREDWLIGEDI
ncbi:MAG: peptidase M4 family protein, partial [Candidatus Latescibacteria bacterium]|nr:peptidase M4 family protein [Candidatus Latescibacterota bacterium]